jgi:serine/threonine-protein kinase
LRYQAAAELKADLLRLKRDSDSGRTAGAPAFRRPRRLRRGAVAILGLAGLVAVVALAPSGWRERLLGHGRITSLVVLPFANATDRADATALSDGIAESLINALTQVPELRIIARSTAFQYRNEDPLKAGRALDVEAVLTGRVGRQGELVTVQVDLLSARDGRQLWGQRFSAPTADVTTIQDRLAREAAEQLRLRLSGSEERRLTKRVTANNEAYLAYLRGRQLWNQRTASSLHEAISAFERAVALDPLYAEAYAALGETHGLLPIYARTPPREAVPRAKEMARRALELDEGLGAAWSVQAFLACRYEYDFASAERAFRQAIALNPGYSTAYDWFGICLAQMGRFDEAVAMGEQALKYDPLSLIITADHGQRLLMARRLDEAVGLLQRLTATAPAFYRGHYFLGQAHLARKDYPAAAAAFARAVSLEATDLTQAGLAHAYARMGRSGDARALLEKLTAESRTTYVSAWAMANVHAGLGEPDPAFEWLYRAYDERSEGLARAAADPLLDPIRDDPRFPVLLRRIGLRP